MVGLCVYILCRSNYYYGILKVKIHLYDLNTIQTSYYLLVHFCDSR